MDESPEAALSWIGLGGLAPIDAGAAAAVTSAAPAQLRFDAPRFLSNVERLERTGISWSEYRGVELLPGGIELPVLGRARQPGRLVLDPTPGTGRSLEQRVVAAVDPAGAVLATPRAHGGRS